MGCRDCGGCPVTFFEQTQIALGPLIPTGRTFPALSPYQNFEDSPTILAAQISTGLAPHINALDQDSPFIWLFEVEIPTDPPTRYRFNNGTTQIAYGADINGDPVVYDPYKVKVGKIIQNKSGDLPTVRVVVSNVTREVGLIVDTHNGLSGQAVTIRIVNSATLLDPTAEVRIDSVIRSASVNNNAAMFVISPYNLQQHKTPSRRYLKNHCNFHFGQARCGYQLLPAGTATNVIGGGFDTCQKQFEACTDRGLDEAARSTVVQHPKRAGFFRGIPRLSAKVGVLG